MARKGILLSGLVIGGGFLALAWLAMSLRAQPQDAEFSAQRPEGAPSLPERLPDPSRSEETRSDPQVTPQEPGAAAAAKSRPRSTPHSKNDVTILRGRVTDPALSPEERVQAFLRLRAFGNVGEMPEVLSSMANLLLASPEEHLRLSVCKGLRGTDSPQVRQQLVATAVADTSPRVRSEAIETLAPMASDPVVRLGLKQALEREKDLVLRNRLERALSGRP